MKGHWSFLIGAMALTAFGGVFVPPARGDAQADAERTRRELRQQGFKTDLSDFDAPISDEMNRRVAALDLGNRTRLPGLMPIIGNPDLMIPIGDHGALVIWKEAQLENPPGFASIAHMFEKGVTNDMWQVVRGQVEEEQGKSDEAARAILSGPIQFHLNLAGRGPVLLPHAAALRMLAQKFSNRAVLVLHDGDKNAAWTNLLAATRLATAWQMESTEVSYRVRCMLVETAYNLTWQALQAGGWPDERLAGLQQEWESLDLLKVLPDVVAFNGASDVAMCQAERQLPVPTNRPMANPLKAPRRALGEIEARWADEKYRNTGTYVDEKDMLLFYRDRVLDARRASASHSWAEMRQLPGVTKDILFQSQYTNHHSMATVQRRRRQIALGITGGAVGLMGRAAEAEARRRLIVTAIALERFHNRHQAYPKSLAELVPEFVNEVPVDFMDGKPLRYAVTGSGQFYLYSVGLDCVDDGGKMLPPLEGSGMAIARRSGGRPLAQGDLVWPIAATADEVKAYYDTKRKEQERLKEQAKQRETEQEAAEEEARQTVVKKLLTDPQYARVTWRGMADNSPEPLFKGQPLSKFFGRNAARGAGKPSLTEMLTLKQVPVGSNSEMLTLQLPLNYDAVTNMHNAEIVLLVDSDPDSEYPRQPQWQGWERATNGDSLLRWDTSTEIHGQHALQALLRVDQGIDKAPLDVKGPVMRYLNANLIQFFPESALFNDNGANLYARLPESNGVYTIEIKTLTGTRVKTIAGLTTNGLIDAEWDLVIENGSKYTNNSFESFFSVRLPASGRSQALSQRQNKIGTSGD